MKLDEPKHIPIAKGAIPVEAIPVTISVDSTGNEVTVYQLVNTYTFLHAIRDGLFAIILYSGITSLVFILWGLIVHALSH